jgi:hypothetical protein
LVPDPGHGLAELLGVRGWSVVLDGVIDVITGNRALVVELEHAQVGHGLAHRWILVHRASNS